MPQKRKRDFSDVEIAQLHQPCPGCGSSDALTIYTDGHGFCFAEDKLYSARKLGNASGNGGASRTITGGDDLRMGIAGQAPLSVDLQEYLSTAKAHPLVSRGITQATCKKWDYLVRKGPKGYEQIAVYHDPKTKHPETCKIRTEGKDFFWEGPNTKRGKHLYGQSLWGAGGRSLTITEGEIDALSVSQVFDHKYPVVSVPNGAAQAHKAVAQNLEWINSFEKVVFMFDMDQPGRDAATECAKLLPPGKAFIATLPEKDANECLKAGKGAEITKAFWNAQAWRPDGLVDARQLTALCLNPVVCGIPWPWEFLTKWTYGRRRGETYWWGGGTGIGKTDFLAEIVASTITGKTRDGQRFTPEACVLFSYETGPAELKKAIAGKLSLRRFHIPQDPETITWTDQELRAAMDLMDGPLWEGGGKLFINDSFGAADWDAVKERIRYVVHAENVRHAFVDPIGALVMGAEDERKFLDELSLDASMLAQELSISIYLASHLTRPTPPARSHEEGGNVRLSQFRGSNGIAMFAFYCFGLERNQQALEEVERTKTIVRSLKDRYTGNSLGKTQALYYDTLAGTLDVPITNQLEVPPLDAPA